MCLPEGSPLILGGRVRAPAPRAGARDSPPAVVHKPRAGHPQSTSRPWPKASAIDEAAGMWTTTLTIVTAAALAAGSPAANWVSPVSTGWTALVRAFERPLDRFAPGHRGVDFQAPYASSVQAIGPGRVAFVGDVAGIPTVSVEHSGPSLTSTYQPVDGDVEVGMRVAAGEVLGTLAASPQPGSGHCRRACLHLGLRRPAWESKDARADRYVDPRAWIQREPVLKPLVP